MSGYPKAPNCQLVALQESAARFGGTPWLTYQRHLTTEELLASAQSELRSLSLTRKQFQERYTPLVDEMNTDQIKEFRLKMAEQFLRRVVFTE